MTIGDIMQAYKDAVLVKFDFLRTEFDFALKDVEIKSSLGSVVVVYAKKDVLIRLGYEPLEKRFYYYLNDGKTILIFHDFFRKYDKSINWPELMPLDGDYEKAMDKNILLLRKYGHNFLSGKERLQQQNCIRWSGDQHRSEKQALRLK